MVRTLFFDLGGVCLTNAWDVVQRENAARYFQLDYEEMERRHGPLAHPFERGELSLHQYLAQVVFYVSRQFCEQEFVQFMQQQSQPINSSMELLAELKRYGKYRLAVINNESMELNLYRIEHFQLERYFSLFFSSCFLGIRKPDPRIYQIASNVPREQPGESLFIDDRIENVEAAKRIGMNSIHARDPRQLRTQLRCAGIEL